MRLHRLAPLVAALALASSPLAAERTLKLQPKDVAISFALDAGSHVVHGTFALREGEVRFDPEAGTASGRVVVDVTSGETGNAKRDKKMHGKVLESATYPTSVVTLTRVEGSLQGEGKHEVKLVGTMELHGATHDMELPASVEIEGERVTATAHLTIPYVEWGLADPSFLMFRVAKTVDVTVELKSGV